MATVPATTVSVSDASQGQPVASFLPFITVKETDSIFSGPYTLFGRVTIGQEDFLAAVGAFFATGCALRALFAGLYYYATGYALLALSLAFAARQIRQLTIYSDIAKTSEELKESNKKYEKLNEDHAVTVKELNQTKAGFSELQKQMQANNATMQTSLGQFNESRQALEQSGVQNMTDVAEQSRATTGIVKDLVDSFRQNTDKVDAERLRELSGVRDQLNKAQADLAATNKEHQATTKALAVAQKDLSLTVQAHKQQVADLEKTRKAFNTLLPSMQSAASATASSATQSGTLNKEAAAALQQMSALIATASQALDPSSPAFGLLPPSTPSTPRGHRYTGSFGGSVAVPINPLLLTPAKPKTAPTVATIG